MPTESQIKSSTSQGEIQSTFMIVKVHGKDFNEAGIVIRFNKILLIPIHIHMKQIVHHLRRVAICPW